LYIEDYLSENISSFTPRGDEATGECPFCAKGAAHWYIHIGEGKRNGRWICFSCDERGDFWKLVQHLEGMGRSAARAWWAMRERDAPPAPLDTLRERVHDLRNRSVREPPIATALPYGFKKVKRLRPRMLVSRGVSLRTAREYGLGYCAEGDMAGRVVFPINCPLGKSWTARAVGKRAWPKYYGGDGAGRLLYGWDVAFRTGLPETLVVCEGPMDVVSLYQAGVPAVAVMSKKINDARSALLRRTGVKLMVALDSEARQEAVTLSQELNDAPVVLLESGDPGDTPPDVLLAAVNGALDAQAARRRVLIDRVSHLRRNRDTSGL
jgi:hypothetical protein